MRIANDWKEYALLDASGGERLERWGDVTLIRPDPQIIWKTEKGELWDNYDAKYIRSTGSAGGGGYWEYRREIPESWEIGYKDVNFSVRPTGFKHTGLFPEQAVNWDFCRELIKNEIKDTGREINILNLFAYTGGATLACLEAGAKVCHVDAVKSMVEWAKNNARLSGLSGCPVRWIADDAVKFLAREKRRGNKYDGVILDPPSYGRGTGGEMWRLEDSIFALLTDIFAVLSENPLFIALNSYTTGLSPSVMAYLLNSVKLACGNKHKTEVAAEEIGLPVLSTGMAIPCGNTAIMLFRNE